MKKLYCPTCETELTLHEAGPCLEEWLYDSMGFERQSDSVWRENESQYWRKGISFSIEDAFWFMQRKIWRMTPQSIVMNGAIVVGWWNGETYNWEGISGSTFPIRVCRAGIYLASEVEV